MTCSTIKNLGVDPCANNLKATRRLVLVPILDNDGNENYLSETDILTKAAWQAKFDAANTLDRFYPTPKLRNVTIEPSDPNTWDAEDGAQYKISDGVIPFTAMIPLASFDLVEAFRSFEGKAIGFYLIDDVGNILGYDKEDDGNSYPIPVDADALFDSVPGFPSDSQVPMVSLSFQIDRNIDYSKFKTFSRSSFDFNPLLETDFYALINLDITVSGISTTGYTIVINDVYGNAVSGVTKDDVTLYNDTQSSSVTLTSMTEDATTEGEYLVVMPAQTSADSLTHTMNFARYDKKETTILIP